MTAQIFALCLPAALIAALCFGVSGVLQQRSTHQVAERAALRFGLLLDLLRQPLWLFSLVLDGVGAAAQTLALATGSVALVQPLLVTTLLFAVVIGAWMARQRPDRLLLFGSLLCGAGLAAFLGLARPYGGTETAALAAVLPLAITITVVVLASLVVAARFAGQTRALALATACGVLYGTTAGLGKLVLNALRDGLLSALLQWPLYALIVTGLLGFLLNQNAFQAAHALAPVLALITVLDPITGIAVGVGWLSERVTSTPGAVAGEVVAIVVMTLGVVVLARRSPQLTVARPGPPEDGRVVDSRHG
ncbi:MAG: DMT family transporter [Sciscionella sp.]